MAWHAIPAFEDLQTWWKHKQSDVHFEPYADTLQDGLDKILKYYTSFGDKPALLMALHKYSIAFYHVRYLIIHLQVLHPYYGLLYIKHQWGGADEQAAEIAAGNLNVKNWQDEAMRHLEDMVSFNLFRWPIDKPPNLTRWNNTTSQRSMLMLPLPPLPPPLHIGAHTMHIPLAMINIANLSWRAMTMMTDGDQNSTSG